jgi:hypothetical protein
MAGCWGKLCGQRRYVLLAELRAVGHGFGGTAKYSAVDKPRPRHYTRRRREERIFRQAVCHWHSLSISFLTFEASSPVPLCKCSSLTVQYIRE